MPGLQWITPCSCGALTNGKSVADHWQGLDDMVRRVALVAAATDWLPSRTKLLFPDSNAALVTVTIVSEISRAEVHLQHI